MTPDAHQELCDLLGRLCDQTLDDVQQARLYVLLTEDAEARRTYLNWMHLHACLAMRGEGSEVESEHVVPPVDTPVDTTATPAASPPPHVATPARKMPLGDPDSVSHAPSRRVPSTWSSSSTSTSTPISPSPSASHSAGASTWYGWPGLVITLLLAALLGMLIVGPQVFAGRQAIVGHVVDADRAIWARSRSVGDVLTAGDLKLLAGTAQIRLAGGAELYLRGPVMCRMIDARTLELHRGRLTLHVPQDNAGLHVITRAANFVPMSTECGIEVERGGNVELHVWQGVVVVSSRQSEFVVPVLANEAALIHEHTGDLTSIPMDRSRFLVSVPSTLPHVRPDAEPAETRAATDQPTGQPLPSDARLLFLGDRLTDRETHLLMLAEAVGEHEDLASLRFFNAGIAFPLGFTDSQYLELIQTYQPTHAVLEFGSEIAMDREPRSVERFDRDLRRLVVRLQADGIEPIVETTALAAHAPSTAHKLLEQYNDRIRQITRDLSCRLIDFPRVVHQHPDAASNWFAPDGVSLTVDGYHQLATLLGNQLLPRAVPIPTTLAPDLLPGVITHWQYRYRDHETELSDVEIDKLQPDATWLPLTLPQEADKLAERAAASSFLVSHRDRLRGFATGLVQGSGQSLIAISSVSAAADTQAYLNTGATLRTVWLNGVLVYHRPAGKWTGWHAGKERIPIRLRAGTNRLVIEAQDSFFVSITDVPDWSVQ